jgi:hypothetical protein
LKCDRILVREGGEMKEKEPNKLFELKFPLPSSEGRLVSAALLLDFVYVELSRRDGLNGEGEGTYLQRFYISYKSRTELELHAITRGVEIRGKLATSDGENLEIVIWNITEATPKQAEIIQLDIECAVKKVLFIYRVPNKTNKPAK